MEAQFTTWLDALVNATQAAVNKVIWFTPNLIVALLLLLIGSLAGRWVGALVEKVLDKIKLEELITSLHFHRFVEAFGMRSIGQLMGKLAHLFIFLITLIAAADIVHLPQVTSLVQTVLLYIPKAVVALLILVVGMWAAKFSGDVLKGDLVQKFPVLKSLIRFLIMTFALLASLHQFDISSRMVEILFAGLIFALSLACGLAFGLGGKEFAKEVLDRFKRK